MISFELTEEETLARSAVQALATRLVRPAAGAIDRSGLLPRDLLDELWRAGIVQGIFEIDSSAKRSRILSCIILEELGWADATVATAMGATMSYVQALMDYGTLEQRCEMQRSFDQPTFRGAAVLAHEPGFAANIAVLSTVAEPTDSGYVIDGAKAYVPIPEHCGQWLVLARCKGISEAFIVSADAPGVRLQTTAAMLGLKGLALATLRLDGVRVAREARLGGDEGCDVSRLIAAARLGIGAILTGLSRAVFEHHTR